MQIGMNHEQRTMNQLQDEANSPAFWPEPRSTKPEMRNERELDDNKANIIIGKIEKVTKAGDARYEIRNERKFFI
jgi:hypothetical protein